MHPSTGLCGFLGTLVIAVLAAPLSGATCAPAKTFSQWDATAAVYRYTYFQAAQTNASVIGALWQTGARGTANEGSSCEDSSWLNFYAGTGKWYINGFLNGLDPQGELCQPTGCPQGDMTIVVEAPRGNGAEFGVTRIDETPPAFIVFNYSRAGSLHTQDIPRPSVTSSSRTGPSVAVQFSLAGRDSAYAGLSPVAESISAYRIVRFKGNADPGRDSSLWVLEQSLPYESSGVTGSLAIDCADTTEDQFLATQISYDDGQYLGALVSASVRIECDPNLANPGRRFKPIDRPWTDPPRGRTP